MCFEMNLCQGFGLIHGETVQKTPAFLHHQGEKFPIENRVQQLRPQQQQKKKLCQ